MNAPAVPVALVYGNTLLWAVAALFAAAAFRRGIAWSLVFKPTDLVFGLPFAARSRVGFAVAIGMSAILLPHWLDWLDAIQNLQGSSLLRNLSAWPALTIPLIAFVARAGGRPRFE